MGLFGMLLLDKMRNPERGKTYYLTRINVSNIIRYKFVVNPTIRRAVITIALLRVQFLLTFWGEGRRARSLALLRKKGGGRGL